MIFERNRFIEVRTRDFTEWEKIMVNINSISTISRVYPNERAKWFQLLLVGGRSLRVVSEEIEDMFEIKGDDHE